MPSPYLDRVRPAREVIEDLIAAREAELSRAQDDAGRRRIAQEIAFLRDELRRLTGTR